MAKQRNNRLHHNKTAITPAEVRRIRFYLSEGVAMTTIARMAGRAYKTIEDIRNAMIAEGQLCQQ